MKRLLLLCSLLVPIGIFAQQTHSHGHGRVIEFPDIPGYQTLKCDFHMHTVFSDGSVWPNIRVQEAIRDGLDAVSMTDHLEYQPHIDDIPHPDRNRSYEVALDAAKNSDLIVVRGSEITRSMPPGHANAIFIEDANKLMVEDSIEVFREAKRQGAFVFWNHPNWHRQKPDGKAELTDVHKLLIKEGLLDGIEIVNDVTYSDEALQIALDNDLTIMGTSDIHGLVDWQYKIPEGGHRPITLVFASERSEAGIQSALEEGRTVAWFNNILAGKGEYLVPLVQASLSVDSVAYISESSILTVMVHNHSDADYILQNLSPYTFHSDIDIIHLPHQQTTQLEVKTGERLNELDLPFRVLNTVTAPKTHPEITVKILIPE